ncbi:hypothetical protein BP6252_10973 [Coleophoma cylindrospora]|uniref:Rhodopsin domain-containing protein n=1 Tax=Coleophoma cylindrospora TaxID=1849047 RepID=A0A3D8QP22_9HELO|nr:hypothetical protein BP6252_10973 [Coleophoma cylindrospora]
MALFGFGGHQDVISPDDLLTLFKIMFAQGIPFYLCLIALRLSFCSLFLRITSVPWQRKIIYGVAIVTTITNVVILFRLNIFYCSPISLYWDEYTNPEEGSCISSNTTFILVYLQYSISIIADWVTSLLPLFLLRGSLMDKRVKFMTCGVLGTGILASAAGIASIVLTPETANGDDYTYTAYGIFVAQTVEPFIGIIAASVSTYLPLFKHLLGTDKVYGSGRVQFMGSKQNLQWPENSTISAQPLV